MFWRQHQGKMLLLVVYVDDLIITDDDVHEIADLFRQKTLYFCDTFYALKNLDPWKGKFFPRESMCLICSFR